MPAPAYKATETGRTRGSATDQDLSLYEYDGGVDKHRPDLFFREARPRWPRLFGSRIATTCLLWDAVRVPD